MARPGKKRRGTPPTGKPEYRDGVVIVHGVGHQEPGDTLRSVAPHVVETLSAQGFSTVFEEDQGGSSGVLRIEGGRSLAIAEAFWADIVEEARVGGVRGALLRVRFAFASLPYLVVGAIGPRGTHTEVSREPPSSRLVSFLRRSFGLEAGEFALYAPLAWRVLPLYGVAVALTALFSLAWWAGLAALVGIVILLLLVLSSPGSIIEHIRMAAEDGAELKKIRQRVSDRISAMEERCERVWVIAHSQGGYIAHSMLAVAGATTHPRVTRLTGLASGVRPIRLARLASSGRMLASSWMILIGSAVVTVGMLQGMEPDGFFGFAALSNILAVVTIMMVLPVQNLRRPDVLLDRLADGFVMGWNGLPMIVVGLVVTAVAFMLRRGLPHTGLSVEDLPPRIRWDEASSPSDLVGSMAIPELPDRVNLIAVPSIRSALFDHGLGAYFARNGSVRFLISSSIAELSLGTKRSCALTRSSTLVRSRLAALSRQLYVFRGSLIAAVLFFMLGVPVTFGSSALALAPTVLVPCLAASVLGWGFAYLRWSRVAPIAVSSAFTGEAKALRNLRRAIRPAARESVIVMQFSLMGWSILTGIGVAGVGAIVRLSGSQPATGYDIAAVRLIDAAMMLAAGAICLIARMGRPKLWNVAALLVAQSALVALAPDPSSMTVVGAPGVVPGVALIVVLIVHLCRRSYPARPSDPGDGDGVLASTSGPEPGIRRTRARSTAGLS